MAFTFVLKDKGTKKQGWWLKITNVDELFDYYEKTMATRNSRVLENYIYGKEWNPNSVEHAPHYKEAPITQDIVIYGANNNHNILQAITEFQAMVISNQLKGLRENGAIYINKLGGYHSSDTTDKEFSEIHKSKLVFPEYDRKDIRISRFPYGNHYYAHVGNVEVKDGDKIKWNTYEEAYRQAEKYLEC